MSRFASLSAVFAVVFLSVSAAFAADKPNVVLVLCDDIRWDALSCAGHPHIKTPHIDQMAAEGLYFENMFCTTSLCSPSRASILSGLYAHSHGVTNNFTDYPEDLDSFPRRLQAAGYETGYIGKWHMGEANDEPRPGFDHFVTHKGQGSYFDTAFNTNGEGAKVVEGYYTTVVTDMAIDWMKQDRDKPFCLMLGHKAPHSFYFPEPKYEHTFDDVEVNYPHSSFELDDKPEWITQRLNTWHGIYGPLFDWRKEFPDDSAKAVTDFARMVRAYWGTILSVDDSVGRMRAYLESIGQLDNTVFIFMGDNGLLEGEHGMVDKRTAHEASARVPLIIRYPKLTAKTGPQRVPQQVLTVDIAPTVVDLCGAEQMTEIQGESIAGIFDDRADSWRTSWIYHYNYEKQFPYTPNVVSLRTDKWKLIRYPHGDGSPDRHMAELYDLENDLEESTNLIGDPAKAGLVKRLNVELDRKVAELGITNDIIPLDQGIGTELPDKAIR